MNLSELDTVETEVIIGHHAKTLELPLLVRSVVSREVKENLLGVISRPNPTGKFWTS